MSVDILKRERELICLFKMYIDENSFAKQNMPVVVGSLIHSFCDSFVSSDFWRVINCFYLLTSWSKGDAHLCPISLLYVACASRVLVIIPLSALLATNGFIKGVVVFQVDWGMWLISAAEGVWMVTLLR